MIKKKDPKYEILSASSDDSEEKEIFKKIDFSKYLVLDHRTKVYALWSFFINALSIGSSFIYAHFAAYRHEDPNYRRSVLVVIEVFFLIDLCMHFFLSYEPKA